MSRATLSRIVRRAAIAAALATLAPFVSAAGAEAGDPHVVIRVYDSTPNDAGARADAIDMASAIAEDAGLAADWRDCSRDDAHRFCYESHGTRNLIVRIVPTFVAWTDVPRSSGERRGSAKQSGMELGFAVVNAETHAGVMATIFHDRVLAVAQRTGVEYHTILGRAIAHEIGHLLLGTAGHGRAGLMREVWTDEELTRGRREDWTFAPHERRRLQTNTLVAEAPALQ